MALKLTVMELRIDVIEFLNERNGMVQRPTESESVRHLFQIFHIFFHQTIVRLRLFQFGFDRIDPEERRTDRFLSSFSPEKNEG